MIKIFSLRAQNFIGFVDGVALRNTLMSTDNINK